MKDLPTFSSRKTCQCHDVPMQCGPRGLKGYPEMLFHNNGDGTFTEVATQAGEVRWPDGSSQTFEGINAD